MKEKLSMKQLEYTTQQLYAEREGDLRRNFKDHQPLKTFVDIQGQQEIQSIVWGKPGTSIYRIIYLIHGPYLIVLGDMGEAVYRWSEFVSMPWLAGLDLQYFHSKTVASEEGCAFSNREWDEKIARVYFKDLIEGQYNFEDPEDVAAFEYQWGKIKEEDALGHLYDRQEWHNWLEANGYDILGDDWYDGYPGVGDVIPLRCQAHLLGLKIALLESEESNGA